MKDAILKGAGDSRYLKSKIPTGTTWEQALAMLNAGTFPVDLNGINLEGFQQLGTPLNKANLLKDAVSSKLGLVGDKTPNDMFGVLADCGNLHVWRKTVVTTVEVPAVPAGYTLGDSLTIDLWSNAYTDASNGNIGVWKASSVDVSAVGDINLTGKTSLTQANMDYEMVAKNGADYNKQPSNVIEGCRNNFIYLRIYGSSSQNVNTQYLNKYYYVSNDAAATRTISSDGSYVTVTVSGIKEVTGYPYTPAIPAGTHVTYPVSTNRNAYQEGSNAKPAGYTLGDVVRGSFAMATNGEDAITNVSNVSTFAYSDSVTVNNDGVVSISGTNSEGIGGAWEHFLSSDIAAFQTRFRGKYLKLTSRTGKNVSYGDTPFATAPSGVVFIPNDAVFSAVTQSDGVVTLSVDCYQPVTGYPAIGGNIVDYVEKRTDATDGRIMASDYQSSSYSCVFETASSIEFDDSGNISLVSPIDVSVYLNTTQNPPLVNWGSLIGKYIRLKSVPSNTDTYFPGTTTVGYIDSTATISAATASGVTTATITSGAYLISSTPMVHGETIQYLGCLGDKARVQVLSYVGAGTYGADNPCSITADFPIKVAIMLGYAGDFSGHGNNVVTTALTATRPVMFGSELQTTYLYYCGFLLSDSGNNKQAKKSSDGRTFYWYGATADTQFNVSAFTYYVLAIG